MKWCRLWSDILDDVKIIQLSDYEFRIFFLLMARASEVDSMSGELQDTFKSLSLRFRQRFNHFSSAIETFQNNGLITVNELGFITITNWSKRQYKSDNAYERVKKHRQVKSERNVSNALHETVPDTDTDTDTEKDINNGLSAVKDIIEFLNEKSGKNFQYTAKNTVAHIKARLRENWTPDDFRKVITIKCDKWLTDPKMRDFIRPETLFGTKFESYLNEIPNDKDGIEMFAMGR